MSELHEALRLADKVLDKPHLDPDGDVCLLARTLIRLSESAEAAVRDQVKYCSNGLIHTTAKTFLDMLPAKESANG